MGVHPELAIFYEAREPEAIAHAKRLAAQLFLPLTADPEGCVATLLLTVADGGLELRQAEAARKAGLRIDLTTIDLRTGSGNLSRRQPLARAIGAKNETVLDATAGLGHDAALLACMGYRVTAVERSPIVAALLADALERARNDDRFAEALGERLTLIVADAREVLAALAHPPDVVYIDPMFPLKRRASALAKKRIRLVRQIVGDDPDAGQLLEVARGRATNRVVVKRPSYADPIGGKPDFTIAGKLVRYDAYLSAAHAQRTSGEAETSGRDRM